MHTHILLPRLPPPPTTSTLAAAYTEWPDKGAEPRAVRPTVGRDVHHSQDTRSTHKTQSRKEGEQRERQRLNSQQTPSNGHHSKCGRLSQYKRGAGKMTCVTT